MDRVIGRIVVLLAGDRVEVARHLGVCAACSFRVAVDDGRAVERREQPLVRIDRDRVGGLDAAKQRPGPFGEQCGAAVGGVDVQPQAVRVTHLGDTGEVVDGTGVRSPGCRHDAGNVVERCLAQDAFHGGAVEASVGVAVEDDVAAHDLRGGRDRRMCAVTRDDQPWTPTCA